MQSFGKRISNWWLLALVPVAVVALPVLLMGFFMANNLAGALFGPPAIWNRTWHNPPRQNIVGSYSESERHLDDTSPSSAASLTLEANGSMAVANLPTDFGQITCTLSGAGSWSGPGVHQEIDLTVVSDRRPGSCESGSYASLIFSRSSASGFGRGERELGSQPPAKSRSGKPARLAAPGELNLLKTPFYVHFALQSRKTMSST
jgi:hypothetical protein